MAEKTSELLNEKLVFLDLEITDKQAIFDLVSSKFSYLGITKSEQEFLDALQEREALGSTFMGNGIAIPHGKSECVEESALSVIRIKEPIYYESNNDSGEVDLIFTFAIPKEKEGDEYLRLLSNLARLLMKENFLTNIRKAQNFEQILGAFQEFDEQ